MPRRNPVRIVEHFVPDPVRCAAALVKLLVWEFPANAPETAQDPACGEAPREEPADQEPIP